MSEAIQSLKAHGRRLLQSIGLSPRPAPPAGPRTRLDVVRTAVDPFASRLAELKRADPGVAWYPYSSLGNILHLDAMAEGENRRLFEALDGMRIADIGAADGDVGFLLESCGASVDIIDNPPTNLNGLEGARRLKQALGSSAGIYEVDLDTQFQLPGDYDFALFLGILYHLKNPYYAMEQLAFRVRRVLLSTRVFRFDRPVDEPGALDVSARPIAYLVDPDESNDDATNYWMFTNAGLKRLLDRCGWEILEYRTVGAVDRSDPWSQQGDERAFALLRSRRLD